MRLASVARFGNRRNTRDSKHLPKEDIFADYSNAVSLIPKHVSAVSCCIANINDSKVQLTDNSWEANSRFALKSVYAMNQRENKRDT